MAIRFASEIQLDIQRRMFDWEQRMCGLVERIYNWNKLDQTQVMVL